MVGFEYKIRVKAARLYTMGVVFKSLGEKVVKSKMAAMILTIIKFNATNLTVVISWLPCTLISQLFHPDF